MTPESPSVSVIIPAYNAGDYLTAALESIEQQTVKPREIIVVDDASPSPQQPASRSIPVRVIRHRANSGQAAARNTGMKNAKGDIYAFLDADDLWRPTHVEDSLKALASSGADLSYSDYELFHESPGDFTGEQAPPAPVWGKFPDSLYVHNFIQPSAVLMKASLASAMDGFSTKPEILTCEDWELWFRIAGAGRSFEYVNKRNLLYRKHKEGATANTRKMAVAKAHALYESRDTIMSVPWFFRRGRAATICAEAARQFRKNNPREASHFYSMAFAVAPWRFRYFAATIYLSFFSEK